MASWKGYFGGVIRQVGRSFRKQDGWLILQSQDPHQDSRLRLFRIGGVDLGLRVGGVVERQLVVLVLGELVKTGLEQWYFFFQEGTSGSQTTSREGPQITPTKLSQRIKHALHGRFLPIYLFVRLRVPTSFHKRLFKLGEFFVCSKTIIY